MSTELTRELCIVPWPRREDLGLCRLGVFCLLGGQEKRLSVQDDSQDSEGGLEVWGLGHHSGLLGTS